MGLALRCASASNKIDLRATLNSTGSRIAGNWEERTFNVSGSASGQASGNAIELAIDAGVLSGSMNVTTNGKTQTISVRHGRHGLEGRQHQPEPGLNAEKRAQCFTRRTDCSCAPRRSCSSARGRR